MTHGIDWDAIERARTAAAPEKPLPSGWFRAKDYGERVGITTEAASKRLTRLVAGGAIEREKMGQQYAYRIKA
jgi:predicted ArsR family transcriptional regulator